MGQDEVPEGVLVPALTSDEPVVRPAESKPTELADDVPPVGGDTFSREPEPTPAEPVIAGLDAAKEVEPHAAELEVAPDSIETVTVVPGIALCVLVRDLPAPADRGRSRECISRVSRRRKTRGCARPHPGSSAQGASRVPSALLDWVVHQHPPTGRGERPSCDQIRPRARG